MQRPKDPSFQAFAELIGKRGAVNAFVDDLFAAESPLLSERGDIETKWKPVLHSWRIGHPVEAILSVFNDIAVDADAVHLVQQLRMAGYEVHLASNQQHRRASHMSDALGYSEQFDSELYSCHLGAAKPSKNSSRRRRWQSLMAERCSLQRIGLSSFQDALVEENQLCSTNYTIGALTSLKSLAAE